MDKFIVAEVTKNWTRETPIGDLIANQFEIVINVNADRGYKLIEWKLNQVVYNDTFCETIIAIFEKEYFSASPIEVYRKQELSVDQKENKI